jgi:hypothetical protein
MPLQKRPITAAVRRAPQAFKKIFRTPASQRGIAWSSGFNEGNTQLSGAATAQAHVALVPGGATAGTIYPAAFRVGHACKDTQTTTGLKVSTPEKRPAVAGLFFQAQLNPERRSCSWPRH